LVELIPLSGFTSINRNIVPKLTTGWGVSSEHSLEKNYKYQIMR